MARLGIFVDGANIFYGNQGKRMDFNKFIKWIADGREIGTANYFNAGRRENSEIQKFFGYVKSCGFHLYTRTMTKNSVTKEWKQSGIDVFLAVKAMAKHKLFDTFVLVSGDYDYMPLLKQMQFYAKGIEIISYEYCLHPVYTNWRVRYIDDFWKEEDGAEYFDREQSENF